MITEHHTSYMSMACAEGGIQPAQHIPAGYDVCTTKWSTNDRSYLLLYCGDTFRTKRDPFLPIKTPAEGPQVS